MCKVSTFVTGVCVGMVAGALVEVMVIPRPKTRKTAVGKAMQRMGNAVDSAHGDGRGKNELKSERRGYRKQRGDAAADPLSCFFREKRMILPR